MSGFRRQPQPLSALNRAEQFQKVGQPKEAMKTLLEFISNKRNTRTWTSSHEALMMALMTLTVELKDAPAAKDALYHYRIMTMASVPGSLENVVLHLVDMVESRCEAQRELVGDSATLDEVEDLEQDRGPEDLLMAVAAAEDDDELRTHREALVPMVRHGWESFRHVLEALRKLPELERVYHDVAVRGLRFLASFKRASEFRRLCGAMRYHLIDSMTAANEGDGFSPESLRRHLQTRFEQLARCASLSLWNEAFRTAETIHEIIDFSGELPDPAFMAAYYDRLAAVFWVSENFLFHAYACYRRCLVNAEGDDAEELATRALLASVVIPRFAKGGDAEADALEGDSERDTKARLAALLAFSSTPSRASLMEDIRSSDLVEAASPAARDLFRVLEESFAPLDLSAKVAAAMDTVMGASAAAAAAAAASDAAVSGALSSSAAAAAGAVSSADVMRGGDFTLGTYRRRISEQAVMRQVTQLSRAYSTISLKALFDMLAPLGLARTDAEHLIISAVRARALDLRVDHRTGVCRFARDEFHGAALRSHLATLGRRLQSAVALAAESAPSLAEDERFAAAAGLTLKDSARRTDVFATARKALPAVHEASTNRAQAIRKFRDDVASAKAVKELQARLALAQEEQEIQARRARLEEEAAAQRAKQLAKEEEERRRRQEVADLLKQLEAIGVTEAHGIEPGEDAKEAITRLLREKAEAEARRQKELKRSIDERLRRLDYYTRATRAVEATKATQLEEKLTESVTSFVAAERERVERFASTRHARNVLLQQEFHKAKTAWPSIERWVEERNAVAWAETMGPVLEKARRAKATMDAKKREMDERQKKEREERAERARLEEQAEALRAENIARHRGELPGEGGEGGWGRADGSGIVTDGPGAGPSLADTEGNWRRSAGPSVARVTARPFGAADSAPRWGARAEASSGGDDRPEHLRRLGAGTREAAAARRAATGAGGLASGAVVPQAGARPAPGTNLDRALGKGPGGWR
ncbi:hypothetical protein FNF29_00567 [Cafeteria roenbergensis]|uniref:eIF3a PCI domain-containing protein n=2 Tax=Cafeteria roenbergensis TaxID=33653 RepID=A0A5A8DR82_CAFRO|nr:hypothetical protein FNF29_00567 [Cafeteria roenbergensis]KAA0167903.1 hypothetical protein FNF28_02649 [Cafeteria roenbergensis]KAA0169058.1 hypothetical protein FNF31_00218 [Cafeteria roenbergensis]|eukprot:KAA0157215.1 hypothetical protein FNF29_00567 [Cafeteria roenbergensis]